MIVRTETTDEAAPGAPSTGLTLWNAARIVWRRKVVVLATAALALGLCAVYLRLAPKVYFVRARVLVEEQGLPIQGEQAGERDRTFLATQAEIMRSPAVVREVVGRVPASLLPPAELPVDPVSVLAASLSVSPVIDTKVLSVGFRCENPQDGVQAVALIIESYQRYVKSLKQDTHAGALRLLTESERELREEIARQERQYAALRETSPVLGQGEDAAGVERTVLARLGELLAETRSRRINLDNQLKELVRFREQVAPRLAVKPASYAAEAAPAPPGAEVPADSQAAAAEAARLHDELLKARAKAAELAQEYGPKHAVMRGMAVQVAQWERALAENLEAAPRALERELAAVKSSEVHLEQLYREEFEKTKALDVHLLREKLALADLDRSKEMHEALVTRLRDWELDDRAMAESQAPLLVRVLEGPMHDPQPAWPQPALLWALSLGLGTAAGVGVALVFPRPTAA